MLLLNKKEDTSCDLNLSDNIFSELDLFMDKSNSNFPWTHADAIGLAAIIYNYDISYFPNPHRFYIYLNEYKTLDDVFINVKNIYYLQDLSSWICECKCIYDKNPLLFSLNTNFNHQFPQKYYNSTSLSRISSIYDNNDGSDYDKLQYLQVLSSFHLGWHPKVESDITIIDHEHINDINANNIIVYGSRCDKLFMFTVDELTRWFKYNNTYKSPLSDLDNFTEFEIINLMSLCRYQSNQLLNPAESKNWMDLISILSDIKNNMLTLKDYIVDIVNNITERDKYISILHKLFELGMYMRGWKGDGSSYPYGICEIDDNDINKIENISWEKLIEFKQILETAPGIKIGKLPIYIYNLTEKKYEESTDPNIGLTIKSRIDITEKANDSFSCIRITSNYIIPTPLFYLQMLKYNEIYDISQISYIS